MVHDGLSLTRVLSRRGYDDKYDQKTLFLRVLLIKDSLLVNNFLTKQGLLFLPDIMWVYGTAGAVKGQHLVKDQKPACDKAWHLENSVSPLTLSLQGRTDV